MPSERILLGRIAGAHGIRGEVLVHSYAEAPEDVAAYGTLADKSGARAFSLKVVRVTPKGVIARIDTVTDRNAAEALKGTELYVARDKLPEADEDEFYHSDLIGLAAVSPEGAVLGKIVGVPNYGAGDLVEIAVTGKRTTELIPFSDAYVPEVDIPGRRVVVRLPTPAPDETDEPEKPVP